MLGARVGNSKASPSTRSLRAPRCQRQHPPGATATASSSQALPVAPEQIHTGGLRNKANRAAWMLESCQCTSPFFKHAPQDLGEQSIINLEWEAAARGISSNTCAPKQEKIPFPLRANPCKGTAFPASIYSGRNSLPTQFITIQQLRQMSLIRNWNL